MCMVVREIRTDTANYNAAHWDGEKWELIKILSGNSAIYSIKYFNENDIWVTSHCFPIHWNGNEWTLYHIQNMGLDACVGNSIWGSSSENMYFVGDNGSIVHYDGSNFEKMESGTEVIDFTDIYGIDNGNMWICGYDNDNPKNSLILSLIDDKLKKIYETNENIYSFNDKISHFSSTYYCNVPSSILTFENTDKIFISSFTGFAELIGKPYPNRVQLFQQSDYRYRLTSIKSMDGRDKNDIYICGSKGLLTHFNGITTIEFDELKNDNYTYLKCKVKDDIIVAVGYDHYGLLTRALVTVGIRE